MTAFGSSDVSNSLATSQAAAESAGLALSALELARHDSWTDAERALFVAFAERQLRAALARVEVLRAELDRGVRHLVAEVEIPAGARADRPPGRSPNASSFLRPRIPEPFDAVPREVSRPLAGNVATFEPGEGRRYE